MTPQLILGLVALAVSLIFNLLQYKWRRDERDARIKERQEAKEEQRRREQTPPSFYSYDGGSGPLRVSGRVHSVQGPFIDLYCLVTVVNSTQAPVKITPLRLMVDGQEWPVAEVFFRVKDGTRERLKKISLRGNDKEDYELHFFCAEDKCPQSQDGEFVVSSDNRTDAITIKVTFP
jgi:hypothetical protein